MLLLSFGNMGNERVHIPLRPLAVFRTPPEAIRGECIENPSFWEGLSELVDEGWTASGPPSVGNVAGRAGFLAARGC